MTSLSPKNRNAQFRGKALGTISSLNEYIAFRTAHGIDDHSYKDLYLGDSFKIQDGTYNTRWMVVHFDYFGARSNNVMKTYDVVLMGIPNASLNTKMNSTATVEGGYKGTIVNNTVCPAIASALSTVLGSYLKTYNHLISNASNANVASMAGSGSTGAAVAREWSQKQCIIPTELQVYGAPVTSSSLFDIGEATSKLAAFHFVSPCWEGGNYWLRDISNSANFCSVSYSACNDSTAANTECYIRPLIYIS